LCCLSKKCPNPHAPDSDMKDENQQSHKDKIYAGEGDNTAEHNLFHHSDSLQAAVVDKLHCLEKCDHADKKAGGRAYRNEGLILAEETEEELPAPYDDDSQNCGAGHTELCDGFTIVGHFFVAALSVGPADQGNSGGLQARSQRIINIQQVVTDGIDGHLE